MRFIIRPGSDPVARANANLLTAMGLLGGGIVALGKTHCLVAPGDVPPDVLNDWFDVLSREDFERSFKEDPRCKGKGMSPSRGKYIAYFKKLNARDND